MAGSLVSALFYLRWRTLQNVVLSRLRRLKQPKYMVGAVIGLAYFYFVFGRRFTNLPRPRRGPPLEEVAGDVASNIASLAPLIGAFALLLFVVMCWVLRRSRAALGFTEAEIAFLFPAPASRQALIHYKLLGTATAAIFTALILGLVSTAWPGVEGNFAMRAFGWWLVFLTLSLHTTGSAFTITRWQDRGLSPLFCQLLASAVLLVVVGWPMWRLWGAFHADPAGAGIHLLQQGPMHWLLYPFGLLLAPLTANDAGSYLRALWPAVALCVVHYLWVMRAQVSFEEASIAKAEKRAARVAAMRAGNLRLGSGKQKARRAPFQLQGRGRPELAFLWKNLLSTAEYLRLRNLLIAAGLIVFACKWFAASPVFLSMRMPLAIVAMTIAAYSLVLGPQLARQDFRGDLHNTDILKTYPLRGWQIMLGEMLTPAAVLTGLIWLMLLSAALLLPSGMRRMDWLTPGMRLGGALGLALLAPLLCLSQLVIVNAAAVLFPAWQPGPGQQQQQGIEVMGQRILFLAGQMLTMLLMLLPAVIVAGVVFGVSRLFVADGVAIGAGLVMAAAALAVEIGVAIAWLGERFEKLDLSQELRA